MPKRTKAYLTPKKQAVCDGLVINVGNDRTSPKSAQKMAQRIVKETLRGSWEVKVLNIKVRDFEVTKPKMRRISVSRSWDYAALLNAHADVNTAEPSLVIAGLEPEPEQVLPRSNVRAASSGGDKHRTCSAPCEWSLELCNVPQAWQLMPPNNGRRFGKGIKVGHPDTGYTRHPEIWDPNRLHIRDGYDFENDDAWAKDPLTGKSPSHGTSTASVIMSGQGSNGQARFVSGAAPEASLVPLRVSDSIIHFSFRNLARAIYYAADHNHHIISMSLGGPLSPRYLERAIEYAESKGVILMAAAGQRWPFVVYPAKFDAVTAVAACNCKKEVWSPSASGPTVDVTAPGESVWRARTRKNNKYEVARSHGTSYAVATTAGICALWLAFHGRQRLIHKYGRKNLGKVFKRLLKTKGVNTPSGWKKKKYGTGIVDANKLLKAPLPGVASAGVRASATTLSRREVMPGTSITHYYDYFPDLTKKQVRATLKSLLGVNARGLSAELQAYGNELLFHIATNPDFRASLQRRTTTRLTASASPQRMLARNKVFHKNASRRLNARLFE